MFIWAPARDRNPRGGACPPGAACEHLLAGVPHGRSGDPGTVKAVDTCLPTATLLFLRSVSDQLHLPCQEHQGHHAGADFGVRGHTPPGLQRRVFPVQLAPRRPQAKEGVSSGKSSSARFWRESLVCAELRRSTGKPADLPTVDLFIQLSSAVVRKAVGRRLTAKRLLYPRDTLLPRDRTRRVSLFCYCSNYENAPA